MDFDKQLENAIARGKSRAGKRQADESNEQMNSEQFERIHSKLRLEISDHIETCIGNLADHFLGFETETIYGERGWGAACYRSDVQFRSGRSGDSYSRLELTVRPPSSARVLELVAKGAVHNREVFNRNYFEPIADADAPRFIEFVDRWVLEYAEIYAAATA
ncbi:MAG: hypothetical protein NXI22_03130 [bacterium]|nr:hypothetical protein [bacterium]